MARIKTVAQIKNGMSERQVNDMKLFNVPGTSFSLSRACGVQKIKQDIARASGIPMTKSGRQRKAGSWLLTLFGRDK